VTELKLPHPKILEVPRIISLGSDVNDYARIGHGVFTESLLDKTMGILLHVIRTIKRMEPTEN
jgi:hypothetical protein